MIIEELLEDGRVRQYSDQNKYILQIETGIKYEDAVDIVPCIYTYEETDEDIPIIDNEEE